MSPALFSKFISTNPANQDPVLLDQAFSEQYSVIQQQQKCSDNAEILEVAWLTPCVCAPCTFASLGWESEICVESRLQPHLLVTLKSNLWNQPVLLQLQPFG